MSFKIPCGGFKLDEKSFSLDENGVLSIPKPLSYDYMPEGYPSKSVLCDIEWDGDTSGLVSVADTYYKVANYTEATKADLVGCILSVQNDPKHPEPFVVEEKLIKDTLIPHAIMIADYVIFVSEPTSFNHVNFTEPGIYFAKMGELYAARLIKQTITPMAEEFLPSEVNDLIMNSSTPDSAKKFKITVDDSGNLTATEV